jgi:hypothetical protein
MNMNSTSTCGFIVNQKTHKDHWGCDGLIDSRKTDRRGWF